MSLPMQSQNFHHNNFVTQMKLSNLRFNWDVHEIIEPKYFKVFRNKPFDIALINYTAKGARCSTKVKANHFKTEFEVDDGNSIIKVSEATEDMTAEWHCLITRKDKTNWGFSFYVGVIGGRKKVRMEIAGKVIDTSQSESLELPYDELGEYFFEDGETVQLVCHNIVEEIKYDGDIYLYYYDSQGTKLVETDRISAGKAAFFQKTMKSTDNNHMIDCIYVKKPGDMKFPYRVIFTLITSTNSDITITINDLKLKPTKTDPYTVEDYHFIYFPNQILTVTCETSNKQNGSIHIVHENKELMSFKEIEKIPWKNTVQFSTKFINKENYKLRVMDLTGPVRYADIWLKASDVPELLILGLTAKDVIDQYTKDRRTWIIDYWYSVGETLYLTCIANDKRYLLWLFEASVLPKRDVKIISYNFTLSDELNESSIICEDKRVKEKDNRKIIIKLYRKSYSSNYPYPTADDDTVVIACAMAASLLAVTTLGFVFYYCRYRRVKSTHLRTLHSVSYATTTETLRNGNQLSIPSNATPIPKRTEQNDRTQEYMEQNSLYDPKTYDDDTAEYQYIDVNKIVKYENNDTQPMSLQVDNNPYANYLAKNQPKESNKINNRTKAEVGFNPHYTNVIERRECSQSPNDIGIYDYSKSYVNSKK